MAADVEPTSVADSGRMERAAGIGGFFFRAKDPEALAAWYERFSARPSMQATAPG